MTGKEFAEAVKAAGFTQKAFATVMGVHRTTIAERFVASVVEPYWVYALAGLIAGNAAAQVAALVAKADTAVVNKSCKTTGSACICRGARLE
ncbi:MAG: hypothetical protein BGO63_03695 [Candidatus Accumulibacter sp. 66-26]|nr:MAG: hypothetical protein BGO63_03695 [Candidatus Accumulibacter sp. 66-26]